MAMISHRLRRALVTAASCVNRSISLSPASVAPTTDFPSVSTVLRRSLLGGFTEATRAPARLFSTRNYKLYKEGDEITEDTVLFEGCDYNHWLITMDFPKDNPLSPEEMVSTYEKTCAAGLGISLEEAKQKIYACSTTTYQGFQAVMTEQESEKFKDLPGVVFILPDSYIDPVNKEYGGDKYENGVITHRPPPIQHNRRSRDRFNQRSDRQGGVGGGGPQNFQRNTQFGQQPPMQGGGGGYGGPQQSYGPPGQGTQAPPPPFQGGYNQGPPISPPPPYQAGYNQGPPRSPPPPYQAGYNQGQGSPVPPYQGPPGGPGNYSEGPQGGYNQGGPRSYSPQGNGNYGPPPGAGNPNPGFGQGYAGPGQEQTQTFPQADQRNVAGDWNNNNPAGQPGSDQFPQGRRY